MSSAQESIKRSIIPIVKEFEEEKIDLEECIKSIWDIDGGVPIYAADKLFDIVFSRENSTAAERDRIRSIRNRAMEESLMHSFLDGLANNLTRE